MESVLWLVSESNDQFLNLFNFYLPPLYSSILKRIQEIEECREIAMIIGYTERRQVPILFIPKGYEIQKETNKIINLNRIQVHYTTEEIPKKIQEHTSSKSTVYKLLSIMTRAKEIQMVFLIHYKETITFDEYVTGINHIQTYHSTSGSSLKILTSIIDNYDISEILETIEYEDLKLKYLHEEKVSY